MKIYSVPEEVPSPKVNYSNYDSKKVEKDELEHQEKLKNHLIKIGYDKPLTGEILKEHVADGYALYMVADGGREWCLIHLPYGDAYQSQNVQFLPKKEVKERIKNQKKLKQMFSK